MDSPVKSENGNPAPVPEMVGGSSVRQYLNENITEHLLEGLKHVSKTKPDDALHELGSFLIERAIVTATLELQSLTLLLLVTTQLEVLTSLQRESSLGLADDTFQSQNNLLGSLGLLVENGLGLTTVTGLLTVVSSLTSGEQRSLTSLVLGHLVLGVLLAGLALTYESEWWFASDKSGVMFESFHLLENIVSNWFHANGLASADNMKVCSDRSKIVDGLTIFHVESGRLTLESEGRATGLEYGLRRGVHGSDGEFGHTHCD